MTTITKPTIGRIVHFRRHGDQTEPLAAIITAVLSDTSVNLAVFEHGGETSGYTKVGTWDQSGDAPLEYWAWPRGTTEAKLEEPDVPTVNLQPKGPPAGLSTTYSSAANKGSPDTTPVEGADAPLGAATGSGKLTPEKSS